jgi:hypothetical protein
MNETGGKKLTDEQCQQAKAELYRRYPSDEAAGQQARDILKRIAELREETAPGA